MNPLYAIAVPAELRDALSLEAWVDALLDAERALANAEALAGVIPVEAAAAIAEQCRLELFDAEALAAQGRAVGNMAEPLVRALTQAVGGDAAGYVHWGATSQDIVDSAAMLLARDALDLILTDLDGVADACAALARTHRDTPIAARTLLQQAVPTTFGAKVAGWLVAVVEARQELRRLRAEELAAQLGGAAGTLAALGAAGPEVLRRFALELDLAEPELPWQTNRLRVARLGSGLALAAGALGKIAVDVALLAQTEVGEVSEPAGGVSSAMPQKQNPVGAVLALAAARLVNASAGVVTGSLVQEQERGLGGWHAEWDALSTALAYTGAAAAAIRTVLEGLEVHAERMRANLDATHGLVLAERLSYLLAPTLGRREAHALVSRAATNARASGATLVDELLALDGAALTREQLDAAADPATGVGSAPLFVDRALAIYERSNA